VRVSGGSEYQAALSRKALQSAGLVGLVIFGCDALRGRATPKGFEQVSKNQLGTIVFASPTICGGEVFLRVADMVGDKRQESLYCLRQPAAR